MGFRLSVAIPVHNEESVLPELLRRTRRARSGGRGSPRTGLCRRRQHGPHARHLAGGCSRRSPDSGDFALANFGHQAALTAALDHVTGDAAVTMDGDLQDVPEAIPRFLEQYWKGYDVVYAQRVRRKEAWPLRLCYFLFYRMLAKLADTKLPLDSGDFGLLSRRVIEELHRLPEHHRYLRGLRSWLGFRQIGVEVERDERHSGRSKYSAIRLMKLASDGFFAFSIVPIRAAGLLGMATIAASAVYALYAAYAKLFLRESPQGFTALILVTTFLSGTALLFLGIIGEYIGRIYEEAKARPLYVVGRVIGGGRDEMEYFPAGARLRREALAREAHR